MVDLLKWSLIDLVKGGIPVRKAFTGSFHPSGESGAAAIKQTPAMRRIQQSAYLHTGEKMAFQKRTVVRQIEGESGKGRGSKRILGVAGRGEARTYLMSRSLSKRMRITPGRPGDQLSRHT